MIRYGIRVREWSGDAGIHFYATAWRHDSSAKEYSDRLVEHKAEYKSVVDFLKQVGEGYELPKRLNGTIQQEHKVLNSITQAQNFLEKAKKKIERSKSVDHCCIG